MKTWNYRVVVNEDGHFSIREVFYDANKNIEGWTDECSPFGENFEEFTSDMNMMMQALQREILVESEIMTDIVQVFKDEMAIKDSNNEDMVDDEDELESSDDN